METVDYIRPDMLQFLLDEDKQLLLFEQIGEDMLDLADKMYDENNKNLKTETKERNMERQWKNDMRKILVKASEFVKKNVTDDIAALLPPVNDLVEYSWNAVKELSIKEDDFASLEETYFCPFLIMKSKNIQDKLDNLLTQRNEEYEIKEKIKNNEINVEDLNKYINSNQKKKERKKKKKNKGKTKNKEQKTEIKTENQEEEEKDDVFEKFKQDVVKNSINRYDIHKIKFKYDQKTLDKLIKKFEEKDNDVENLNDTNKKNNNIEK